MFHYYVLNHKGCMMLLYFKDVHDLEALRIAMGYYFHNEIVNLANNPNNLSSREILGLASRFVRIIDQLDEELDYYDTSEQKD